MLLILSKSQRKKKYLRDVADSFIRIGRLLEQGYPLEVALTFIQMHVMKMTREQFKIVIVNLQEGHSVHESFRFFDMPKSIKSFLYFYENQGEISEGFTHAGELLRYREKTIYEVSKLIRYPVALLFFCMIVLFLMFRFVLPHFRSYFAMVTEAPPFLFRILLFFLFNLPYLFGVLVLCLLIISIYLYPKMKQYTPYERTMKLLSLPVGKQHVKTVITYFFALQLGRLIRTGMSLQQGLKQFENQDYLPFLQQECVQISHELNQGHSFQEIVKMKDYFRRELSFVIDNGERTGFLGSDLEQYSDILYLELEDSIQRVLNLVQPVLFLVIGGFVFILFFITMLPLFQMLGGL
ncbi:competence type IV pilus assembly protein ComGB [Halalkalibacter flavus]|uniref:competence type IV pilus assembly protein ComGB n=1 Tax=Halalkalibacter flavus TaxID=3090668 RepID=UPI002FCC49C4